MAGLLSLNQANLYATIDASSPRGGRSQVALFPLRESKGKSIDAAYKEGLKFQYFPETLQDTKEVHYATKDIPGGSLPIYQWMNSGARTISFTAWFSCDNDLLQENTGQALVDRLEEVGEGRRNVDIRAAVQWLRDFTLPTYTAAANNGMITAMQTLPPDRLILIIKGSGIGAAGGLPVTLGAPAVDSVICVMTQCEVTHHALFTSGLPRLTSVQLAFAQTAQYAGGVSFPSAQGGFISGVSNGANAAAIAQAQAQNAAFARNGFAAGPVPAASAGTATNRNNKFFQYKIK